jgi:hypothetical protein
MTYRHRLGRSLSEGSAAGLRWGEEYRALHRRAIEEMVRVTRYRGLIVVNMSNHVRAGVVQRVVEWWTADLLAHELNLVAVLPVETPRMRFGLNHEARVAFEHLIVVRRP